MPVIGHKDNVFTCRHILPINSHFVHVTKLTGLTRTTLEPNVQTLSIQSDYFQVLSNYLIKTQ